MRSDGGTEGRKDGGKEGRKEGTWFHRVYLRALADRDSPSRPDPTLFLASFRSVFLGAEDPVFVRLVVPPRGVIAGTLSPVACHNHLQ